MCLENELKNNSLKHNKSEDLSKLERAEFLMREALDEDQDINYESAVQLYTEAIDLCLKAVSFALNTLSIYFQMTTNTYFYI
jgi:calpain-7